MPWCYEIRGFDNRLVEIRCGFTSQKEARNAGNRAKRLVNCICYPNLEELTVVVKLDEAAFTRLTDTSPAQSPSERISLEPRVKYDWQKIVYDAFMEPHVENMLLKINAAERAISSRLLDPEPFETDERIALGEALLSLRRMLGLVNEEAEGESDECEDEQTA
jgi:hypothetical protein